MRVFVDGSPCNFRLRLHGFAIRANLSGRSVQPTPTHLHNACTIRACSAAGKLGRLIPYQNADDAVPKCGYVRYPLIYPLDPLGSITWGPFKKSQGKTRHRPDAMITQGAHARERSLKNFRRMELFGQLGSIFAHGFFAVLALRLSAEG